MATVAELAQRDHVEFGYLFVWQGCDFMWTDREELAGSGPDSWIGEDYGPRRVLNGLDLRGSKVTFETELAEGRPETGDDLAFKITDWDDELVRYFAQQTGTQVGDRLSPKMDPAPANLIGTNGDNVGIWGKWVNSESIGPAGERSYYSLFPGGDGFGQDHAALNGTSLTLSPSVVYDSPTHLAGRRCALFRIMRDDNGSWASWQAHHDSGESLIWVGTLTNEAKPKAREWSMKAEGPSSWLRKMLGANRPSEWLPVSGSLTLSTTPGQREDLFALQFLYRQVNQPANEWGASSIFTASDVLSSNGTASTFRSEINTRIATVSAIAGPDIVWSTNRNAEANLADGYVETRIDQLPEAANFVRAAVWRLTAHTKVWRAIGIDPVYQKATNFDTDGEIRFVKGEDTGLPVPGPGYWQGEFWTVPVPYASINDAGIDANNAGKWRRYKAKSPSDIAQIPHTGGEISLGIGSPVYFEQLTNRAPADHILSNTGGLGVCDAQAYIALRGSYQDQSMEEPIVNVALAQISYRADSVTLGGDTIALDDDEAARVFISKFIDPRFHGVDRKPLKTIWAAPDLEYCPVNFCGYAFQSGDMSHRILLRLLLSTGGAFWTGTDGAAVLTPGANHPAALDGLEPFSDAEIQDMSLAVPHALINIGSFGAATASLPDGGIASPLNRVRLAWVGPQDSQELIASILGPRGFGLGFSQNKWRLFSRPAILTDADVETTISPSDFVGSPEFVEVVNIQAFKPRETFNIDFSKPLVSEGASDDRDLTLKVQARDVARGSRRDNGNQDVDGWGCIPIPLWRGENPPPDWRSAWTTLFSEEMAGWFNSPQILVEGLPVLPSKARELGVGVVVRFTSLYAPNREGGYGHVAKLGRVYKVEHDLESRESTIDVLIQAGEASNAKHFAPAAVVIDDVEAVEQRHDVASRTFTVKADAFGHGEDLHDCRYFVEPAWLGVGGDALVYGYVWDGRALTQQFEFLVESVNTAGDMISYQAGSLSGTFVDSAYTVLVLAPPDAQPVDSWTRAFYSVITKSDFTWGAGEPGYPLV